MGNPVHSKLYDISTMPAPTESIPFIYLIHGIIILQIKLQKGKQKWSKMVKIRH